MRLCLFKISSLLLLNLSQSENKPRLDADDKYDIIVTGIELDKGLEGRIDLTVADMWQRRSSWTLVSSGCHFSNTSNLEGEEVSETDRCEYA